MTKLPAICEHCGNAFFSNLLDADGVTNLTLSGNQETCPHCGHMTGLLEGTFTIQNGQITFVDGPSITLEKLARIQEILAAASTETTPEQVDEQIEQETGEPNFTHRMADWAEKFGYVIDTANRWKTRILFVGWFLNEIRKVL